MSGRNVCRRRIRVRRRRVRVWPARVRRRARWLVGSKAECLWLEWAYVGTDGDTIKYDEHCSGAITGMALYTTTLGIVDQVFLDGASLSESYIGGFVIIAVVTIVVWAVLRGLAGLTS